MFFNCGRCYCLASFQSADTIENGVDHRVFADCGVDHQIEALTIGPVNTEISFDVGGAVAVNGFDQLGRLGGRLSAGLQAFHFFRFGGVDENVKCVAAALEIVRGAASDDDAIPALGDLSYDAFGHIANTIGVRHLHTLGVQAALVAAAHERAEEAIGERVLFLCALFDDTAIAFHNARDLVREQLVPELPAEAVGDLLGDFASAAAVFTFDGDDSNHRRLTPPRNRYSTTIRRPPSSFFLNAKESANITAAPMARIM